MSLLNISYSFISAVSAECVSVGVRMADVAFHRCLVVVLVFVTVCCPTCPLPIRSCGLFVHMLT